MRTSRSRLGSAVPFAVALLFAVLIAPAAIAAPLYEPNDTLGTAYGPLAADTTYSDTIATADDEDNYYFYVTNPNGSRVHVTVDDPTVGGDGVYFEIDDSKGDWIDYADVDSEGSATLDENLAPGKYYVSVQAETEDQVDEGYNLSIDASAGALGSYASVQSHCKTATNAASSAQTALNQAEQRLRRARMSSSTRRKVQARHTVKVAKARLAAANAAIKAACAIPARLPLG